MVQSYLASLPAEKRLNLDGEGTNALAAWFLGPRGENAPVFTRLIQEAIEANVADRTASIPTIHPTSPLPARIAATTRQSCEWKGSTASCSIS